MWGRCSEPIFDPSLSNRLAKERIELAICRVRAGAVEQGDLETLNEMATLVAGVIEEAENAPSYNYWPQDSKFALILSRYIRQHPLPRPGLGEKPLSLIDIIEEIKMVRDSIQALIDRKKVARTRIKKLEHFICVMYPGGLSDTPPFYFGKATILFDI